MFYFDLSLTFKKYSKLQYYAYNMLSEIRSVAYWCHRHKQ